MQPDEISVEEAINVICKTYFQKVDEKHINYNEDLSHLLITVTGTLINGNKARLECSVDNLGRSEAKVISL